MTRSGLVLDGPNGSATISVGMRIGGGAFGEVYRGVDSQVGRDCAIKFPTISYLADDIETAAFRNDVMAAGRVHHRNVVEILYANAASDPPYIVMEFIDGGTLMAELRRRAAARDQLPPEKVREWLEHLVDGIEAINAQLIHRDIKPDNILISDGVLKISDFGLSKIVDAATRTQTFKEIGAMAYLAPEAWLRETSTIQRDMYAVGLVMFEIATLEYALPVPAERNRERWRAAHLYEPAKRLSACRSDLPAGVEQVLLRLVAKRPQDRFSAWADVRRALETAWTSAGSGDSSNRGVTDRVVRAVTAARASRERAAAANNRAAEAAADVARAASFQWRQLLDEVEAALADLVKLGTIDVKRQYDLAVTVDGTSLGYARLLDIPEHKFRNGGLASTVASFTTACGQGFNAILRRDGIDDPYGRWQGVGWERNAMFFMGRTVEHKPEPFALDVEGLKRSLKIVDGMTSDLQMVHVGDIPRRFVELLAACLEQPRRR